MRECPNRHDHTPCPRGARWHKWAKEMLADGYRQIKCPGCGLYLIWVSKQMLETLGE